jgi:hypothetical protein
MYAHRYSYTLSFGEIQGGLQVCHRCDVRACVNPKHLFLGTQRDNIRDMIRKGRRVSYDRRGARNPRALLNAADVLLIRRLRAAGESLAMIAERFSITRSNASNITNGYTWKHLTDD